MRTIPMLSMEIKHCDARERLDLTGYNTICQVITRFELRVPAVNQYSDKNF
jgi:hypothetical protein